MLPDRALLSRSYRSNDGITEIEVERVDPGALFPSEAISYPCRRRRDRLVAHVIEDGMPRLVDDEVFEEVQRKFAINKRRGAKTKAELAAQGEDAPDYWLTERSCCLACGGPMESVSGTSKTGRTYRHYYCLNQRKKKCSAKTVRKDAIELRIVEIVESFLAEPELLTSLAVNLADHYKQTRGHGDEILKALEARQSDVETKLANFVKAISQGILTRALLMP